MKTYTNEDGSYIELTTKDTDMLIITFFTPETKQFAEIRLRGAESDAVIKRVKNRL